MRPALGLGQKVEIPPHSPVLFAGEKGDRAVKIRVLLSFIVLCAVVPACQQAAEDSEEAAARSDSGASVVEAAELKQSQRYERQILSTAELMKQLMDPIYEDLKDAIEFPPERRKAWRALYIAAFNLAEVNNLLFSREPEDGDDEEKKAYLTTPEWIEESIEAVDLLVTMAESVRAQADYDVLKANYMAVMNNCNQCHHQFEPDEIDEIMPPESWSEKVQVEPDKISFI